MLQLTLSMTGVIGLILFMFWLMRKVNKQMRTASGSKLRILDRAITGRDSSLVVISVSGKLMLIGVSVGKIEKLCDLDTTEEEYFSTAEQADKPGGIKFSDVLYNFMNPGMKKRDSYAITEKNPTVKGEETTVEVEPDN
jgi:flagellar biogenesis protein FliO